MPRTIEVRPRGPQQETVPRSPQNFGSLSDPELLEGLRRASEPHFNELYSRYFQRIYNFTYARIRNHADVEEIVQETFTVVFRSAAAFRGTSSLLSWIYGIAKNTLNNQLRRAKNHELRMEQVEPELVHPSGSFSNCTPEEKLSLRRCADAVGEQLASVSDWQTEIFVMRHMDNLSISQISERTNRSSDAIRSSLYRVKRMLVEAAGSGVASVQS